jgi:hypothetical protein
MLGVYHLLREMGRRFADIQLAQRPGVHLRLRQRASRDPQPDRRSRQMEAVVKRRRWCPTVHIKVFLGKHTATDTTLSSAGGPHTWLAESGCP